MKKIVVLCAALILTVGTIYASSCGPQSCPNGSYNGGANCDEGQACVCGCAFWTGNAYCECNH
jgi:hypothetical protein